MIGLVSPVEWNVYKVCPSDMYLQVIQFFSAWGMSPGNGSVCCVVLRSLAPTKKSLRLLLRHSISYNWCSFKDVIATGG